MKIKLALSTILLAFFPFDFAFCKNSVSFFVENDMGYSDKYATNSLKLQYTNENNDFWTNLVQFAFLETFVSTQKAKNFQTISVGHNINVPRNISEPVPSLNERPYAGWLYFNAASHIAKENSLDTFAITLGIVGRHSYAGDIQC